MSIDAFHVKYVSYLETLPVPSLYQHDVILVPYTAHPIGAVTQLPNSHTDEILCYNGITTYIAIDILELQVDHCKEQSCKPPP